MDVSNTRLPDPPTSTNQVYAFMQKLKNFSSLSKNLTKLTKKKSPTSSKSESPQQQPQPYENTQFYVRNDYQNVEEKDKSKTQARSKTPKLGKKKDQPSDPYENFEFHSPRTPTSLTISSPISDVTASSPNLNSPTDDLSKLTRKKSKSGKSFKSKFRKSMGSESNYITSPNPNITDGTSNVSTRSTFYISDSVDVDSGIFTSSDKVATADDSTDATQRSVPLIEIQGAPEVPIRRSKRLISSPELNRRKSTLGIRPNNPPPPPPPEKKSTKSKRFGTTSWYAECGVFKADQLTEQSVDNSAKTVAKKERNTSSSSWYADAGLYQTSGASEASSSGSSGVSTGGECGPGDDNSHSMFLNEPLYQIYSAAKLEVGLAMIFSIAICFMPFLLNLVNQQGH